MLKGTAKHTQKREWECSEEKLITFVSSLVFNVTDHLFGAGQAFSITRVRMMADKNQRLFAMVSRQQERSGKFSAVQCVHEIMGASYTDWQGMRPWEWCGLGLGVSRMFLSLLELLLGFLEHFSSASYLLETGSLPYWGAVPMQPCMHTISLRSILHGLHISK